MKHLTIKEKEKSVFSAQNGHYKIPWQHPNYKKIVINVGTGTAIKKIKIKMILFLTD